VASKARFGRLPRAAPSLTSTIVALAQEYQRVRESNIVDAWKNGGEFEGKPVHDDQILKWFKARRDEISPGDPKWDYYDNQVTQYEFAIANSKMELSYKQKKTSDAGMVAFYHKWASKLPPDSEAYREREKLAAAYADRAATNASNGRRAAADRQYASDLNKDYKKEFAYDQTTVFLESEAHNRGILQKGEKLGNVDPNTADGHAINALWDEIAHSPEYADQRAWYTAQIKKNGDANFNGDFSQDAYNAMGRTKKAAVTDRITVAKAAGRAQDVKNFRGDREDVRAMQILSGGFDEMAMYEDAHKEWLDTVTDPDSTPLENDRATEKYKADLTKVKSGLRAQLKPGEVDDRLGAVDNELKTLSGDEHPYQHWGGMFGPGENEGGKSATETAQSINNMKASIENLGLRDANGDPLFFLMKVDNNGVAAATTEQNHKSAQWGVVARGAVDPNAVFVIQADAGDPRAGKIVTAIKPTPIYIAGDTANATTGDVTITQSKTPGAYHYTMPDGTVGYKYQDAAGKWLYTPDNPFGPNAPTIDAKGGSVYVPTKVPGGPVAPSSAILPAYYNPAQNVAMTSRVAKSGYGMWLIASDPKHGQAYAAKPEDIIASLKLEAGGDPARFQEMVIDADQRRAIYLGNSTDEQNRIRQNYYNGTPNPVPLTTVAGISAPSAEGRAISELTGAPGSQAGMEARRGGMADALSGKPQPSVADTITTDELARRNRLAPNPPQAGPIPMTAPTSLGAFIPGNIAGSLVGIIQQVTGNAPNANLPTGIRLGSPAFGNPLTGAPPTAPQPAAPKPVAPAPPKPAPTVAPAPTTSYGPTPPPVYAGPSPRDTHGPGHGALEYG